MNRWYQQLKNIYHYLQAHLWRAYYRWPDRKLKLYGITGTNGKTTTSIVLGSVLRAAIGKDKVGLITTELFWFGKEEETNKTHMTSVDARVVYVKLRRMVDTGVTDVVIEMTSHALDQHRLAGLKLEGAIILNIRHEHLDYHRTMEEYAAAKVRIVNYVKRQGVVVYNQDEEWVMKGLKRILNFKTPISSEFKISNDSNGRRFVPFTGEQARDVETLLPGDFNKENVLAASLVAREVGISEEQIKAGVAEVKNIPGRVEWITFPGVSMSPPPATSEARPAGRLTPPRRGGGLPRVVIDFALTPYAYERLFKYLRGETKGKLIAVFGAAGRRDKEKRPKITKIVAKYADEIVLTQDEPYDDPEEEIYAQLEEGLKEATIPWKRIEDRREAIKYAIAKSGEGDVVAVPGMGNYDVRMVGDRKIPWKDKTVIEEILRERGA